MSSRRVSEPAVRKQSKRYVPRIGPIRWRMVSLILVLILMGVGAFVFLNPNFYVSRVEIGGNRYVPPDEIFALTGVADYHILWVEPDEVAERLAESQSIDAAEVYVRWPSRVVIVVREREPALIWEEPSSAYWVDVNGNLMVYRRDLTNVVRIVNEAERIPFRCPGPGCPDGVRQITIQADVVSGAQQLKTLRPEIDVLYYNDVGGLSFDDPRGWRVYAGRGLNMDAKLLLYEQLVADLLARGIQPAYVDVSNPQAPFYGP